MKRTGEDCEFQEFRPSLCKPIIDEIDCILAKHYGFTDEELDFIVNSYRVVRESGVRRRLTNQVPLLLCEVALVRRRRIPE